MNTCERLRTALIDYDRRQAKKASYNRFALAHYMAALGYVRRCMEAGHTVRASLTDTFTGRLLDVLLKAVGEPKATDAELRGNIRRVLLPGIEEITE